MKDFEIFVGQDLVIKIVDFKNRTEYINVVVTKKGRLYFYVSEISSKFYIKDKKEFSDFSSIYTIYENMEAVESEIERVEILTEIKKMFSGYGNSKFTLKQLRDVREILNKS